MRFWEPLLRPEFQAEDARARDTATKYLGKFGLAIRSEDDWQEWALNVAVLDELHAARESGRRARVPEHVDRVLSGVRLWVWPDTFPNAAISYQLTFEPSTDEARPRSAGVNASGHIDNLRVFWQAVWLSFFDSRVFAAFPSICWSCFELLPSTPKTGMPSKQKQCARCRKRESRRLNSRSTRAATSRWKKTQRALKAERRKKKAAGK
jgi:hypothetical protein